MKIVQEFVPASRLNLLRRGERIIEPDRLDPKLIPFSARVHDYSVPSKRPPDLRAIHAWTCFGAAFAQRDKRVRDWGTYMSLHYALEDKLLAVRYRCDRLRACLAAVDDMRGAIQTDPSAQVMSELEAFVSSIYTALELVAGIIHERDRSTPKGFTKLAPRHALLRFDRWHWLQHFWDIRTELTHFNAPGLIDNGLMILHFTQAGTLRYFHNGRREIPLSDVVAYEDHLFDMLDEFALKELEFVDPTWDHGVYVEDTSPYVRRDIEPAGVILDQVRARTPRPPQLVGPALKQYIATNELVRSMDLLVAQAAGTKLVKSTEPYDRAAEALRSIGLLTIEDVDHAMQRYYPQLRDLAQFFYARANGMIDVWEGISLFLVACILVGRVATEGAIRTFAAHFGVTAEPPPPGKGDVFVAIAQLWGAQWATQS